MQKLELNIFEGFIFVNVLTLPILIFLSGINKIGINLIIELKSKKIALVLLILNILICLVPVFLPIYENIINGYSNNFWKEIFISIFICSGILIRLSFYIKDYIKVLLLPNGSGIEFLEEKEERFYVYIESIIVMILGILFIPVYFVMIVSILNLISK